MIKEWILKKKTKILKNYMAYAAYNSYIDYFYYLIKNNIVGTLK